MLLPRLFFFSMIALALASGVALAAPAKPSGQANKPAATKPNICSITLNSKDELETFKAEIGEKNANFIELTDLSDDEDGAPNAAASEDDEKSSAPWLRKACRKGIRCDVLLVSGHFGGTFFGESGLSLSMEELESSACDKRCDGILQNPKEVYLFGCNTLAGKKQDHRSPEEYRRVLRADGFTTEQAEQIVAFRYSPIGDAFGDRMRRVFQKTPRIYGFDSVGPSGKNVRPLLKNYFKSIKGKDYYTLKNLQNLDEATNGALAAALRVTAFTQAAGAKELQREQIPACFLNNDKVAFFHKLNWVNSALNSDKSFSYLPAINDWLMQLDRNKHQWTDKEFDVIEPVQMNTKLRDSLSGVVAKRDSAILGMQMKILTFMNFFGWVLDRDYAVKAEQLLVGDLNQDFDLERKDQICSYAQNNSLRIKMTAAMIPEARWSDPEFISMLRCVSGFEASLMEKAATVYAATDVKAPVHEPLRVLLANLRIPETSAPRYYQILFPQGDQLLTKSQSMLLCEGTLYSASNAMWQLPGLNPAHLENADYLKRTGCYIKYNRNVVKTLLQQARLSLQHTRAVIQGVQLAATKDPTFTLDDQSQMELLDLTLTLDADSLNSASTAWAGVRNISPQLRARVHQELEQLATKPSSHLGQILDAILTGREKTEITYCDRTQRNVQIALDHGHWSNAMIMLDNIALNCWDAPTFKARLNVELLKSQFLRVIGFINALAEKDIEDELTRSEISPTSALPMMQATGVQLANVKSIMSLASLNARAGMGRQGLALKEKDIASMISPQTLAAEALRILPGTSSGLRDQTISLLGARAIESASVNALLEQLVRTNFKRKEFPHMELMALGRQDPRKASEFVVQHMIHFVRDKEATLPSFPGMFDEVHSPLISLVKKGLREKTIPEEAMTRFLSAYAGSMRDFARARSYLQAFGREFTSPKIQSAVRDAIMQVNESEGECREYPRACWSPEGEE